MEGSSRKAAGIRTGSGLLALTLLLAGTSSPIAFSASWSDSDCSESAEEIQPELTLDGLTLDPVDHPAIEPTERELDQAAVERATREHVAPFLFLAPRVASVLKDVFGDGDALADTPDAPYSPIAERDELTPFPSPVDNELAESDDFGESALPLLQRQMYRIDI